MDSPSDNTKSAPFRALTVVLAMAACSLCAGAGCKKVANIDPGPPTVIEMPRSSGSLSIVSVGDVLLADAAGKTIREHGFDWLFTKVAPLLAGADLVIGNLEAPITRNKERFIEDKKWTYKMPPLAADALRKQGFHAFCLANNHILDYGPAGLTDTIETLRKNQIESFGAGSDENSARRGLVYDFGTVRIGLLGYYEKFTYDALHQGYADVAQPGPALLDEDHLAQDIRRMRQHADVVIVTFHWGRNYENTTAYQRKMGARAIELGADIVNGHHPHVAQGIQVLQGKPIVHSVGNFVFGTLGRFQKKGVPAYGLAVRWLFEGHSLRWLTATPFTVDNRVINYQPQRVGAEEAQKELQPRLEAYKTEARWIEDTAVIGFEPGWQSAPLPSLPWMAKNPPSSNAGL